MVNRRSSKYTMQRSADRACQRAGIGREAWVGGASFPGWLRLYSTAHELTVTESRLAGRFAQNDWAADPDNY